MAGRARQLEDLRRILQDSVVKCSERCLYQSAKWSAELLTSIPEPEPDSPGDTEVDSPISEHGQPQRTSAAFSYNEDRREAQLELAESSKYLLAKSYFDCREFDRCAAVFLPMTLPKGEIAAPKSPEVSFGSSRSQVPPSTKGEYSLEDVYRLSQKSVFLALYAKYMAGEKRRDEESEHVLGPLDVTGSINRELVGIGKTIESYLARKSQRGEESQGWLEYLYGIVQAKSKNDEVAKRWLIESVNRYSFNWGAWQELNALVTNLEEHKALEPQMPKNVMSFIYRIFAHQELFAYAESLFDELKSLKRLFPTSVFLDTQEALLHYHRKDFEQAESIFSQIVQDDPLRIDSMDTYSNILYVMDKRPKLAVLAHLCMANDKFRPETCCVVGNYYGIKSEHEKAVMYFRRALVLDRNFLSAWTLMGHEYVELKNTQTAIECYRRAVDINRKDYRAWYGLGQTYEMLEMQFYALFYYERAAVLCPYDSKMWTAVASCLFKMGRYEKAVKIYKRALTASSPAEAESSFNTGSSGRRRGRGELLDPEILYQIAMCYDHLRDEDEVREWLDLTLKQEELDEEDDTATLATSMASSMRSEGGDNGPKGVGVTQTTSKARMWLAKIEFARGGKADLMRAMHLANELCEDRYEVEEAKALLRDCASRLGHSAVQGITSP